MFCLGCGSEIPFRSEYCPVCGQRIGPLSGVAPKPKEHIPPAPDAPATPDAPEPAPSQYVGAPGDISPSITSLPGQPPRGSGSIGLGDLRGLSIPRDTPGRVALGAAIAIIVSVFLPWATFASSTIIPIQVGLPAFVFIGAAVVTALPIFWAPARRRLPAAAAPFGLGACLLGVGIVLVTLVGPFASSFITQAFTASTGDSVPPGAQIQVSAGLGLYLFLCATAALALSGYVVLIEAIAAATPRTQTASASAPYPSHPEYPAQPSLPVVPVLQAGSSQVATVQQPMQSSASATSVPPQPGELRWEQQIASPPVVRRPATGGRPGSGRAPRR